MFCSHLILIDAHSARAFHVEMLKICKQVYVLYRVN